MTGMTYARFFPSDWRTGCLVLNLEEEGLYIRVCMFMYDTGRALPDNDAQASHLLRVHIHKYRKVMASLIAKGKMIRAQGIIFNERVQEEIDKYKIEFVARSEAAKKREADLAKKREEERKAEIQREVEKALAERATQGSTPQSTPGSTPQSTPPVYPGVTHGVAHGVSGKKPNEINEGRAQPWHSRGTGWVNLESRIQNPEEEDSLSKRATEDEREKVLVNGSAIHGPGFKLDFKAIDMVAALCGAKPETARAIAEVCARDWAANGVVPDVPMARVKSAIVSHTNTGQVQEARLGKASAQAKSHSARFDELVDKAEAKKNVGRRV